MNGQRSTGFGLACGAEDDLLLWHQGFISTMTMLMDYKSIRPASGTARYLSSTNWSPQMNVVPRIRSLVPRCACGSHLYQFRDICEMRSRRPSAPADATIAFPAWLAFKRSELDVEEQ